MPKKAGKYSTDSLTIQMVEIFKTILETGSWSQSKAAIATGMAQPNISLMIKDPLARIHSWSRILEAVTCLGYDINITIARSSRNEGVIDVKLKT